MGSGPRTKRTLILISASEALEIIGITLSACNLLVLFFVNFNSVNSKVGEALFGQTMAKLQLVV